MRYEAELGLLRDTFEKCRISTAIVDPEESLSAYPELQLHLLPPEDVLDTVTIAQLLPTIAPNTIYYMTSPITCNYLYLRLPITAKNTVLFIGPYLMRAPDPGQIMEWCEKNGVSPRRQKELERYLSHVPVLSQGNHLFAMVDAFADHLWGSGGFRVETLQHSLTQDTTHFWAQKPHSKDEDSMLQMQLLESRYAYENKLIDAVAVGQFQKAEVLMTSFASMSFAQRLADPVRNAKNYCIILNTLLRKAAEKGGVHPFYLDSVSSAFALDIEALSTLDGTKLLMQDMLRTYCRLVRKHSMKGYTAPVQRAITIIDADLSANLTLQVLAGKLNVSSSYLSALFRKETGLTLTDFINQRRIQHAMYLLETTHLQVQTIAQHCGFLDVHYFTKVFKRIAGHTPRQHRQSPRK